MRLKRLRIVGLVTVALGLAACGGGGPGEGGEQPAGAASTPRFLSLGTAPVGGAFFVVGGALAEVLNTAEDQAWQFTAEATKGTQENIRRLARGELDLALANAAISYFALRGTEGWSEPYEIRTVMTLAPNVALFISPTDSQVASLPDLSRRRVVLGPAGAGFEFFLRPILAAHGLTYDDLTPLNATQAGAVDMLADRSAAAAFLGGAVPTASITQASSTLDLVYVPYDESAIDQLVSDYPFFDRATIPAGTYSGLEADYSGLNVGSMHLITMASTDEETVYAVTRHLWEKRELVVQRHAAGRAIQAANVVRDTGTEFHPGAVRFYRDAGLWPTAESGG